MWHMKNKTQLLTLSFGMEDGEDMFTFLFTIMGYINAIKIHRAIIDKNKLNALSIDVFA